MTITIIHENDEQRQSRYRASFYARKFLERELLRGRLARLPNGNVQHLTYDAGDAAAFRSAAGAWGSHLIEVSELNEHPYFPARRMRWPLHSTIVDDIPALSGWNIAQWDGEQMHFARC